MTGMNGLRFSGYGYFRKGLYLDHARSIAIAIDAGIYGQ
jgi:hypothetical protein